MSELRVWWYSNFSYSVYRKKLNQQNKFSLSRSLCQIINYMSDGVHEYTAQVWTILLISLKFSVVSLIFGNYIEHFETLTV